MLRRQDRLGFFDGKNLRRGMIDADGTRSPKRIPRFISLDVQRRGFGAVEFIHALFDGTSATVSKKGTPFRRVVHIALKSLLDRCIHRLNNRDTC